MRFGSFAQPSQIGTLAAAGGEYAEFNLVKTVMTPQQEFEQLGEESHGWALPVRSYSVLLRPEMAVTGTSADLEEQDAYLAEAFARVAAISREPFIVVFGSGASRNVPDGFDRDRALAQLEDILRRLAALALVHGGTLAFEPLKPAETNLMNSVAEAGAFLRERSLDGVGLVADLWHMMAVEEPLSSIDEFADLIVHTHIADEGRAAPGTGSHPFSEFFRRLKTNDYRGDCSIECRWVDFDAQITTALAFCRGSARVAGW